MNVHLIVAHPNPDSFNYALHKTALATLKNCNLLVSESDLYKDNFDPVTSDKDTPNFPALEYYSVAKAQRWAQEHQGFEASIEREQAKLMACDLLILQFPLWWWSFPAILKGWIDRVLTAGFAYGQGATLAPKKVMYSLTTGGASNEQERAYYQAKIDGLYQDVFGFMGWQVLPPYIAHGVQKINDDARIELLDNYKQHLNCVLKQVSDT
ncbi:NAD(P)H dehydrogenase [Pseudoalteromonas sp. A25]|uniref:NAD(P)H-dependent oxidoreductase n=1 Tax=Pseudoalteromonas sp. A25 TaxID=116092 RepID=UPI00129F7EB3|nr:NAD(P)H-dependent oxidoreductase [Pseudoalteromonas sp. A25]BBN83766.1 NAD(P)H dehydrogenase [Pseudoalteromonas sp. A25]